jgi:signal transduction histidine kinase
VKRTVADLPVADADRIRVSAERGLPLVRCDPDRHWQILMNLLSNALKFSAPETPVEVELSRCNSMVQVAVQDHGPGIEPRDLPKLFQKFSRVGTRQPAPGKGLGLYVSRAMIEAQGGQMWVQSEPGRGSTFVYTLPSAKTGDG